MTSNLIQSGIKTMSVADAPIEDETRNVIQQLQVKLYDAVKNCGKLGQYGLYSNAPSGSFVIVMQVNGQDEVLFGIEDDVNNRPRALKEGEVMLYNTLTKSFIYLDADSNIQVYSAKDLNLNITGNVNLTAQQVNITASTQITGGMTIDSISADSVSSQAVSVGNGASGTFTSSVTVQNGIVTGGS